MCSISNRFFPLFLSTFKIKFCWKSIFKDKRFLKLIFKSIFIRDNQSKFILPGPFFKTFGKIRLLLEENTRFLSKSGSILAQLSKVFLIYSEIGLSFIDHARIKSNQIFHKIKQLKIGHCPSFRYPYWSLYFPQVATEIFTKLPNVLQYAQNQSI